MWRRSILENWGQPQACLIYKARGAADGCAGLCNAAQGIVKAMREVWQHMVKGDRDYPRRKGFEAEPQMYCRSSK